MPQTLNLRSKPVTREKKSTSKIKEIREPICCVYTQNVNKHFYYFSLSFASLLVEIKILSRVFLVHLSGASSINN